VLQGVLDPHSANWGEVSEKSMQILLNGLAKNEPEPKEKK
jgi:hypothetical protein